MRVIGDSRLTIRHLFAAIPIAALAWAVTTPFSDNSFLWHVRAGELQLNAGEVLRTDPFTIEFLNQPWRTQSWLADLLYGSLEAAAGGIGWAPYLRFGLVATTVALVLATVMRRSHHAGVTAVASLLLCWQAVPFAAARPAAFSYVLVAAVAAALIDRHTRWVIPGLVWLWASLHGSFVVGIGLVVLVAVRERSLSLARLAGASVVTASLTAHGIAVWEILSAFLRNRDALALIQEWQPPDFSNPFMLPFGLLILAAVAAGSFGRLERRDLIVVLPFLFFGMLAVRNLFVATIVVLPYVAAAYTPPPAEQLRDRKRRTEPLGVVLAAAAVVALLALAGLMRPVRLSTSTFPSQQAMAALEPGPVFHGIATGGYLIYAEWPERPVLVDDRAELFGEAGFSRYLDVAEGRGWEAVFADLDISQALIDPDWALGAELIEAGWREAFRDDNFVVLQSR